MNESIRRHFEAFDEVLAEFGEDQRHMLIVSRKVTTHSVGVFYGTLTLKVLFLFMLVTGLLVECETDVSMDS